MGIALAGLLAALLVVGVPASASVSPHLSIQQMAHTSQLFGQVMPPLVHLKPNTFAGLAWGVALLLWPPYLWLIWRLRSSTVSLPIVVGAAIGLGLICVAIPPVFSTDLYSYAIFGRMWSVYGVNPYLTTPAQTAGHDALMPFVVWQTISSPYGPLWTTLSGLVAHDRSATPIELVVRFKLVALAATWFDGWMIHRFVKRRQPARANWAYLAFAWNPLVLMEGIVSGHNEVVVLACALGGAWALQSRPRIGALLLAASALIKYSTVPMLGASALRFCWRAPKRVFAPVSVRVALVALALCAAAFLPFWHGWTMLASTLQEPGRGMNNPMSQMAAWAAAELSGGRSRPWSPAIAVALAAVVFGAWQIRQTRRADHGAGAGAANEELAHWGQSIVVFLLVWPRVQPWYWLLPLGLALASGSGKRRPVAICVLMPLLVFGSWLVGPGPS